MRKCKRCGFEKEEMDFPPRSDGYHRLVCRSCLTEQKKAWRYRNIEKSHSAVRRWRGKNVDAHRRHTRDSHKRHRDERNEYARKYRLTDPLAARARDIVKLAVKKGTLVCPSACEQCDAVSPLNGHHDDYSKPLEVKWLCAKCHRKTMKMMR